MNGSFTTDFPIRTCTKCANVLIFTYTCHSGAKSMRDFASTMAAGGSWKFICRACRTTQIIYRDELVCSREQVGRVLNIRTSALDKLLPENPRPRSFGKPGKIRVEDLRAVMERA